MKGTVRKRGCTCEEGKKCKCGATWSYRIDSGEKTKSGRRGQIEKGGFRTKADAEAALAKVSVELTEGTYLKESNIAFGDFADEWLKDYGNSGKVKPSTLALRRHEVERWKEKFTLDKLKNISRSDYQSVIDELSLKYAYNTVSSMHRTGRLIFRRAEEVEAIKSNPTKFAQVPRKQVTIDDLENRNEIVKYMEKEQLAKFLNEAKTRGKDLDYPAFLVLAYTGMRVGELCALKWRDIDFTDQTISITKTYYNPYGVIIKYELLTPKTKTSVRVISVDEIVINTLKDLKAKQNLVKMENRDTYHDHDFVYAKLNKYYGYPEPKWQVRLHMLKLLKQIGMGNEGLTVHSLRHTHTSLLAEAGATFEEIMDRLGHKSDVITRAVYLHVTKTKKKEASDKFANLMRSF